MSTTLINPYMMKAPPPPVSGGKPSVVTGSFTRWWDAEGNRSSRTFTHLTTKPAQDGKTAIIWVVNTDGNTNTDPWLSQEGLDLLFSVNSDTFGDDIAVYIEFPEWSAPGTPFERTFHKVPDQADQGVYIASFEVENLDPNDPLVTMTDIHSSNAVSRELELTVPEDDVLLFLVTAVNVANNPDGMVVEDDRGFDIIDHFDTYRTAHVPYTLLAVKEADAGTYWSPRVATAVSDRKTLAFAALRGA